MTELEKYFDEYGVDLFINQAHWTKLPAYQILLSKLCNVTTAMQFHVDLEYYAFEFTKLLIYRLADVLINLSETRREFWDNIGVRSYYVPHPVHIDNAKNFHGRDPKKISNTLLYVGRISSASDKNTFAIFQILNEVKEVIPDIRLKVLGEIFDVNALPQIKKFITENHLENNVEFLGYHKDVEPFYKSADVVLNVSPSEGWGFVFVESKFYELPLVLYELPDNELLRDGKGYVAVPQGDYKAAARAIVKILTDTEFRCKLSAEARESIQSFIDYDIAGAWQKVFDDLDNNAPVPPHNIENEKIQTLLIKEISKQKAQNQALIAHLQSLMKR